MIDGYLTASEAAEKWNVTTRTVQIMCAEGKIKGAAKFGRIWAIPIEESRPTDGRITSGQYKDWRKKEK